MSDSTDGRNAPLTFRVFLERVIESSWTDASKIKKWIVGMVATLASIFATVGFLAIYVEAIKEAFGEYVTAISFAVFVAILIPYLFWHSFKVAQEFHQRALELEDRLNLKLTSNQKLKLETERWIRSGQELFDSLFHMQPPPRSNIPGSFRVPKELVDHIIDWQNQVDEFVKNNFPDFIGKYVDRAGVPPFPPVLNPIKESMFDLWRREIGVRVERLKEKFAELDLPARC